MKIRNAIKKALASAHLAVLPHEDPAPVEGTTTALIVPTAPDEDSGKPMALEAGRIHRQLPQQRIGEESRKQLDGETRQRIITSLNRFGPPKDSWTAINVASGALKDTWPKMSQEPVRTVDTASDTVMPSVDQPKAATAFQVEGGDAKTYAERKRQVKERDR